MLTVQIDIHCNMPRFQNRLQVQLSRKHWKDSYHEKEKSIAYVNKKILSQNISPVLALDRQRDKRLENLSKISK